jgi:hypothetical protein
MPCNAVLSSEMVVMSKESNVEKINGGCAVFIK